MDQQLNLLPSGFFSLSTNYEILAVNHTLLQLLEYEKEQLIGQTIHTILSKSTSKFFQLMFYPLMTSKQKVDEMYLELKSKKGHDIPILIYATSDKNKVITCVIVPITKRNEYEDQLLEAKKVAEERLIEVNKVNHQLKTALRNLEEKQEELLKVNSQISKYKMETQKELQLAKNIQETSLTEKIDNNHIQIESYYNASSELSGDIYGFYQINEHQYGVILLDVMGHGISSSLITMSLGTLFQRLISKGVPTDLLMKELDEHLHGLFYNNEEAWHYCTAIYLFIDTNKQTIEYVNAGHPPGLYHGSNDAQKELFASSPPIGSFEGMYYQTNTFNFVKGSRILLYTDGVSESHRRVSLNEMLKKHISIPIDDFKQHLLAAIQTDNNQEGPHDDQCFIIIDLK
ncbi:SpoIIE family protein phosphatase [Aquibacillus koreensis]|uniref:SpoIIE family protein phosphatase n=1 Tax=Aquibacillus koreensis TaxID=279446 RepID=A0A9X3WR72_9BACI|nr:SpoIIE family protein phosphatase [Aquibacillus koreensis]MCT2536950.1 SpoIIE family protein phosphatase [Aquibacillus koreensis]MDC3421919.1 SpoIIE family protein phosphatase [Aquibacillus koreensis]